MGVKKLEVRIDELVLHGFAAADRFRIGEAVERELARLMSERRADLRSATRLDGGRFHVAPGSGAEAIGGQIARAVHGGLAPTKVGRK